MRIRGIIRKANLTLKSEIQILYCVWSIIFWWGGGGGGVTRGLLRYKNIRYLYLIAATSGKYSGLLGRRHYVAICLLFMWSFFLCQRLINTISEQWMGDGVIGSGRGLL
jgi:hypothetical protein